MKKKKSKGDSYPTPISPKSEADYMAEEDMRTMMKAEEIKMDPSRMQKMMGKMKTQASAMMKVMGMKGKGETKGMGGMMGGMKGKKESHTESLKKHISKSKKGMTM